MKNAPRKKIIIGYRYDPQRYTSDRIHQIQTIEDQLSNTQQTFQTEQQVIRSLKNQNLLLRAEIQRIQEKSSFKSYQSLNEYCFQLQNECKFFKVQIADLKSAIKMLQQKQTNIQTLKVRQSSSATHAIDGRKYTFSPYRNVNTEQLFLQKHETNQTNRTAAQQSVDNPFLFSKSQKDQQYNQQTSNQIDTANISLKQVVPAVQHNFFKGIDSNYIYNDLKTIQSQKSQQLQSQIQLGYNFSFMPKPLKRNINTQQALSQQGKKVKFDSEAKMLSSSKVISIDRHPSQVQNNFSEQTLYVNENQSQTIINKLNGLKRLPNKPMRSQKHSANSITISDY